MKKPKNLLFVFADQWRRSSTGFSGDDPVLTPNMDRFAQKSLIFNNAVSACPLCSPHRASLLTGRLPLSTGVFTNCKTGLSMRLKDEEITIADVLKKEGYSTGYIGKWHLDEPELNHTNSPVSGAKNWDAYTPPGPRRHGFDFWYTYNAWDDHLSPHYWQDSPQKVIGDKWSPEHETDVAIEWIEKQNEKPFCLFMSWNPPHSPYDMVPEKYRNLYNADTLPLRGNVSWEAVHQHTGEEMPMNEAELREITCQYYAAISGLDEQFERLLEALKKQGQYEDTLIVLSSDHGDMMGSHSLFAKHVWYEESVGIPLVMSGPGVKQGVCSTVVGSADLMPTMLSILGAEIPNTVEGVDVSQAALQGEELTDKECLLVACPGRDIFLENFKIANEEPTAYGWRALRTGTHTYVVEAGYEPLPDKPVRRLLYNLQEDPLQMNPEELCEAPKTGLAAQMEERLLNILHLSKDGFVARFKNR